MEQVLYRKYRPKSFKDALGQEHVTKTLQQAIKSGRISHAYLFTGPKGVGKTSVARILAHAVNGLAYDDESMHLDIIEIDAASNRRIDEIRDLRDKVRIAPTSAKYKVYIIDEVHMLTKEAFNALLKTLEEPPAHSIFILATTESYKLPETIISRTQRFEFKSVTSANLVKQLSMIAQKEGIDIDKQALELLAEFGEGSFRDSIGYLDQLSSAGHKITEEEVRQMLGLPSKQSIEAIIMALSQNDAKQAVKALESSKEQGAGAVELAVMLSKRLREMLIAGEGSLSAIKLLKDLVNVGSAPNPYDYLEILLLEACTTSTISNVSISAKPALVSKISTDLQVKSPPLKKSALKNDNNSVANTQRTSFDMAIWPQIVEKSKQRAASLYTALRLAEPAYDGGILTLSFKFPLHKNKIEQSKNKAVIEDLIKDYISEPIIIECVVDKSLHRSKEPIRASDSFLESSDQINSISNIFGTAEVIET